MAIIINYRTTDLESKTIVLNDCVDMQINGVKINQTEKGISVHVEQNLVLKPIASNCADIYQER